MPVSAKDTALAVLRQAASQGLKDEDKTWSEIVLAQSTFVARESGDRKDQLRQWIYRLALIYRRQTGLVPAFSNGENETRFERFVHAVTPPQGIYLTQNAVKAGIRYFKFKTHEQFFRDAECTVTKKDQPLELLPRL